jgi:hypothetical protein
MRIAIVGRCLLVAAFVLVPGCDTAPITPQAQQAIVQAANDLHTAAGDLHATAGVLATTNAPAAKSVEKVAVDADKVAAAGNAAADAAKQPAATPATVIIKTVEAASDSGLIPPPYASYVKLGLLGVGLLEYLRQRGQAKSNGVAAAANGAAATSMQSAVSAAIGNGSIVVRPEAAATVDALVTSHPAADQLVDTIAAAAARKP